jgi:PIN domain nuclease of toxin-antitoxin system
VAGEIVDTVYLVAYLNPNDPLHREAVSIIESIGGERRISQAALLEFDLLMKSRGFTLEERLDTWQLLSIILSRDSIEPIYPEDFALAATLTDREGLDYFDSLIAAQCINRKAKPLTTDQAILKTVEKYGGTTS